MKKCGEYTLDLVHTPTGEQKYVALDCGSWRCEKCRERVQRMDFSRIMTTLEQYDPMHVYYLVVTLRQRGKNVFESYASLPGIWNKVRLRLRRKFGYVGLIGIVEEHPTGGHPHLNYIIVSESEDLAARNNKQRTRWLKDNAAYSGGGFEAKFERARSPKWVAQYVSKLAAGAVTKEVTKLSQLPLHAPRGMRRLRSSPGFLPPRRSTGEYAGKLLLSHIDTVRRAELFQSGKITVQELLEAVAEKK